MQTVHLLNICTTQKARDHSLEGELSRRRFWACYLINCHSSESMFTISSPDKIATFPLPWPDEDFDRGQAKDPPIYLGTSDSNGGVFSELIRGMTQWYYPSSMGDQDSGLRTNIPQECRECIHQISAAQLGGKTSRHLPAGWNN